MIAGLLGDHPARDYSGKLQLFNAFAAPEIREAVHSLMLRPGMRVLDAGCGTGATLHWLQEAVGRSGWVVGLDIAAAHVAFARAHLPAEIPVLQGDLLRTGLSHASFDAIWSVNTVNHLRDPVAGVRHLATLLRPEGLIALGQSSLLPDMFFAWDARLERLVNEAVHRYYRERYGLDEQQLSGVRALIGWLRHGSLRNVRVRTFIVERISPVDAATESYLLEGIFRATWGERLRTYLEAGDYEELRLLCDPGAPQFALRRSDFHFLQTFTLAVADAP